MLTQLDGCVTGLVVSDGRWEAIAHCLLRHLRDLDLLRTISHDSVHWGLATYTAGCCTLHSVHWGLSVWQPMQILSSLLHCISTDTPIYTIVVCFCCLTSFHVFTWHFAWSSAQISNCCGHGAMSCWYGGVQYELWCTTRPVPCRKGWFWCDFLVTWPDVKTVQIIGDLTCLCWVEHKTWLTHTDDDDDDDDDDSALSVF